MRGLGIVGAPPALGIDLSVAQQQDAVHLNAIAVQLVQQVQNSLRGYSHAFRGDVFHFHKAASFQKSVGLRRTQAKNSVAQFKIPCNAEY